MANIAGIPGILLRTALAGAFLWANAAAAAPGAAQGPVVRPSVSPENAQVLGDLARAASGAYAVAWRDYSENTAYRGAFVRAYAADGTPRGPAVLIDPALQDFAGARIAMDGQGRFIAVWQAGNVLHARRFADDASPMGPSFELMRVTKIGEQLVGSQWQVKMASDGRFAVLVETTTAGLGSQVLATSSAFLTPHLLTVQRFEADGRKRGPPLLVATRLDYELYLGLGLPANIPPSLSTQAGNYGSSFAIDDAGNFAVAWLSLSETGYRPGDNGLGNGLVARKVTINARRYNANGIAQGNLIKVDELTGPAVVNYPGAPAIAMTPQGGFALAWRQSETRLLARVYSAAGVAAGTAVEVDNGVMAENYAFLAVAANGQLGVGWTQATPSLPYLYRGRAAFRLLQANGAPLTPVLLADGSAVNTGQTLRFIANDALGNIVLGWQTHNAGASPGLSNPSIALRRFSGL